MPKGKGTYGTKKGRPPKKNNQRPFIPFNQGRMTPKHGTGLGIWILHMTVTYVYRGVEYTKTTK